MALAFRAVTTQGNATGGALTVTLPTGTVDGDIILVIGYLETGTNTWSGVGSGFNSIRIDTAGTEFTQQLWWKRASGEPASWTWTPTTTGQWRTITAASYSGNTGTGTAVDVHAAVAGLAGAPAAWAGPSVTTTAANDMLTWNCSNFSGGTVVTATGAATTSRSDFGGQSLFDNVIAAAGATGTTTYSTGTAATEDYASAHLAFLLASSGGAVAFPPPFPPFQQTVWRM